MRIRTNMYIGGANRPSVAIGICWSDVNGNTLERICKCSVGGIMNHIINDIIIVTTCLYNRDDYCLINFNEEHNIMTHNLMRNTS